VQLAELLVRATSAAAELPARFDLGSIKSLARVVGASAQHLVNLRPAPRSAVAAAAVTRAVDAPRVRRTPRLPSLPLGGALRSAMRLVRGRWAFRTLAVGIIAIVLSNATLRDAMVAEISWSRSVVQTLEMPTVQLPAVEIPTVELPTIELPTIELPTIELPTIEFPAIQIPAFEIPNFQLPTGESAATSKLVPAQFELPPLTAYRAAFETQGPYPTVAPNATVEWVVALRNTGSVGWYRGVDGAQAALALADGTEAAVQSTAYVAPGDIGWFIARFRAPASPGAHSVALFPRIDGHGDLPDLGIIALVTVR
jgi:hypothetical protein